jgi:hypothetical protein
MERINTKKQVSSEKEPKIRMKTSRRNLWTQSKITPNQLIKTNFYPNNSMLSTSKMKMSSRRNLQAQPKIIKKYDRKTK